MQSLGGLIVSVLYIFVFAVFIRSILSWFPVAPGSPVNQIKSALDQITEPVLGPLRRYLPRLGYMDISPMVAIILILFLIVPLVQALFGL